MGIEFKIDKTNPLEVFPDFPKTWDEMTDKQIEVWLKQLARFGGSEEDIKDKITKAGYSGDVVVENNPKSKSAYTLRIHGHESNWVQS